MLFYYKKEEIPSFATTQMDLEGIMLSEISQLEKDEYCMSSLICEILKYWTQIQRTDRYFPKAMGVWTKWVEGDQKV